MVGPPAFLSTWMGGDRRVHTYARLSLQEIPSSWGGQCCDTSPWRQDPKNQNHPFYFLIIHFIIAQSSLILILDNPILLVSLIGCWIGCLRLGPGKGGNKWRMRIGLNMPYPMPAHSTPRRMGGVTFPKKKSNFNFIISTISTQSNCSNEIQPENGLLGENKMNSDWDQLPKREPTTPVLQTTHPTTPPPPPGTTLARETGVGEHTAQWLPG